ncbi:MAG: 50S ribosomal protein L32 [Candidatus Omnitrophica bacterium]|nr:50S ribosomal protein L32 [Candidatus Omnitrophota bacterium]
MALPKRRHSRQRQAKRRTHDRLKAITLVPCPQCGALKRPHRLCVSCGYYAGKQVKAMGEGAKKEKEVKA